MSTDAWLATRTAASINNKCSERYAVHIDDSTRTVELLIGMHAGVAPDCRLGKASVQHYLP